MDRPEYRAQCAAELQYQVLLDILPDAQLGLFAPRLPSEREDWTAARWEKHCHFPTLSLAEANEHGLWTWEREVATLVHLHGITYTIFHELVHGKLPTSWMTLVQRMTLNPPVSVSDFCDRIAQGASFGQQPSYKHCEHFTILCRNPLSSWHFPL